MILRKASCRRKVLDPTMCSSRVAGTHWLPARYRHLPVTSHEGHSTASGNLQREIRSEEVWRAASFRGFERGEVHTHPRKEFTSRWRLAWSRREISPRHGSSRSPAAESATNLQRDGSG